MTLCHPYILTIFCIIFLVILVCIAYVIAIYILGLLALHDEALARPFDLVVKMLTEISI